MRIKATLFVAVFLLAMPLWAQGMGGPGMHLPPGKWWDNPKLVEELGLTAEQQERIRQLVYEHAQKMVDLTARVKHKMLELEQVVDSDTVDAAKARAVFAQLQEARTALHAERFDMLLKVRQVLTPEQWQKLRALKKIHRHHRIKKGKGMHRHHPRQGGGMGPGPAM